MNRLRASEGRAAEVSHVLRDIESWAAGAAGVEAVALVGSWAREDAYEDSDVDLVVLAADPVAQLSDRTWEAIRPEASELATVSRGVLTECRYVLPSGLEVEIGVTGRMWAATQPLDAGTARVVGDGLRPVHDPLGLLSTLMHAAFTAGTPWSSS